MSQAIAPEILWFQRSSDDDPSRNTIHLTINVPDLQPGYELTFPTPSSLSFKGVSGGSQTATTVVPSKTYAIENLELFGELDLSVERKEKVTGKNLQVQLTKKELKTEYWPRLTKDKRANFVKTDFERWVDEDEQAGADVDDGFASTDAPPGAGMDMDAMMAQMGGGMGGMPGMGGAQSMDIDKMLAQMGSGSGAGQADDDSDDNDSSDEMPPLEDASPTPA